LPPETGGAKRVGGACFWAPFQGRLAGPFFVDFGLDFAVFFLYI
jgi:hypothetical protein